MAENKDEQLTDEELAQLQLAEENENTVDRLVQELGCPTRRIRQFAARVLHLLAERDPQRVVPCVPALIEALDRPEAQTRWEALDALAALATTCPDQLGDAFEGVSALLVRLQRLVNVIWRRRGDSVHTRRARDSGWRDLGGSGKTSRGSCGTRHCSDGCITVVYPHEAFAASCRCRGSNALRPIWHPIAAETDASN